MIFRILIFENELIRIGGVRPIPVNVRVISATSKDMKAEVVNGTFRKDMYYRINVVNITIPPLSERKDDIPLLAHYLLDQLGRCKVLLT